MHRGFMMVWLAASASPILAAPPPKIPVEQFATLPLLTKPELSPDGRRIAAQAEIDDTANIAILDADHPEQKPRMIGLGTASVVAMTWAGNDRLLLTMKARKKVVWTYALPALRLIAVDVSTGAARALDEKSQGLYAGDVLYTDPSGSWALVASQSDLRSYPSVKRIDLATGQTWLIEKPRRDVWDWFADENGVVRAGVSYSGRKWTVWYRDRPDQELRAINGKFDKDTDSAVDKFIFRGGNGWVITNERTGRFGLYKYDLASGAIGEPIFEDPAADIGDVHYDLATGAIKAVEVESDRKRVVWFAADMKQLQEKLDRSLPSATNIPVDWSTDNNRTLIASEGPDDPGRYFLLDRNTRQMHVVIDPYPGIDPSTLSSTQWVRYTARDGLQLAGYLTLPKGRDAKMLPLILMPHGGPYERDHWEFDPQVQFLANRGYAVFQPEFRGSTGFGKDLVAKGYGEWGRKMQDDLDDGVDWLARSGQIDPKRVCIVGASYGGYAAMWGAVRNPERYRCAVSLAGVSDLEKLIRYDRRAFSANRYFKEWRAKLKGDDDADLRAVSPIHFASEIKVPMLIGHGELDANVPSEQSHEMVDELTKAGAKVSSVFYPLAAHGWNRTEDLEDWLKRLEEFLAKYNPA